MRAGGDGGGRRGRGGGALACLRGRQRLQALVGDEALLAVGHVAATFWGEDGEGPVRAGGVLPQDEKAVALFEGELVGAPRIVAVERADGVVGQIACGLGEVLV